MRVEVILALPERTCRAELQLPCGATLADALAAAALESEFAGMNLLRAPVGIFGQSAPQERLLTEGDRVEIYRPLLIDAKGERRARAAEARVAARNASRIAARKASL